MRSDFKRLFDTFQAKRITSEILQFQGRDKGDIKPYHMLRPPTMDTRHNFSTRFPFFIFTYAFATWVFLNLYTPFVYFFFFLKFSTAIYCNTGSCGVRQLHNRLTFQSESRYIFPAENHRKVKHGEPFRIIPHARVHFSQKPWEERPCTRLHFLDRTSKYTNY